MTIDYVAEAAKLLPRIDHERRKALAVGNNRGREQAQVFAMASAVIEGLMGEQK